MGITIRVKLILFGNEAVGKTSLIERYVHNKFEEEYYSTLGYNLFDKTIEIEDNEVNFMIFDIGGQEKFETLRKKYAEGAQVAFLVYDITKRESFDNIKKWHEDLIRFTNDPTYILVGNKVDLEYYREVEKSEGEELAKEIDAIGFFETSAKTDLEVDNSFSKLALAILKKVSTTH